MKEISPQGPVVWSSYFQMVTLEKVPWNGKACFPFHGVRK